MKQSLLRDKGFWRAALRLAVPVAVQNLLISSFSLVDTLMVGQLGDVTLSAAGMAGQWAWLLNVFLFGICSGGSIFISQYWGIHDKRGVHRVYGILLTCGSVICAVFFLTGLLAPEAVIRLFNRDETVVSLGAAYLRIAVFSYPAVMLSNMLSTVLRATEKVRLPMYVSLVTTVMNACVNYVLIFGKLGFPALGIRGAAVSTCISGWAGPLLILVVSWKQKNILIAPLRSLFTFSLASFKRFFSRALPVMLNESLWGMGTLLYNIIFANMGYEYYAALTVFRTFEGIAFVFFVGFCNACCIMVGKKVGAGHIDDAVTDARRFVLLTLLWSVLLGIAINLLRMPLVEIFNLGNNISAQTISTAAWLLTIYGVNLPLIMLPYILIVGVFRSGGDAVTGAKYDLSLLWLFALPVTYLSAFVFKLPFLAVFEMMYAAEAYIKGVLCLRHFRSRRWLRPVTEEGRQAMETYVLPEKKSLCGRMKNNG